MHISQKIDGKICSALWLHYRIVWGFEIGSLGFICYLALGAWCLVILNLSVRG
jgi:hypothetical protein